ncbi:CPBP family intramembrane glutamic endopeptidase [Paenarthrobacter nitroguajacolicus]
MFFLLPSVAQEYFHRQAWLYVLILQTGVWPWVAVLFTSIMFSVEHLVGGGGHTTPSLINLTRWFGMGVLLATAVLLTGQIWPAIICHAMVNAPAAIQPHLRGKL